MLAKGDQYASAQQHQFSLEKALTLGIALEK